ncbi:helix-turn-helix domain-containing protein [Veillonella magna]|uniref:helix-turn-helix domain-containing protein n=1 Tax=Veillonella magna TaxID=464322 RepID=UPI0026DB38F4|nr:helix-turn-helix transcriptional regulator [Veillonella magna]
MTLGQKLKNLRTRKGLSLDELTNELNSLYNLNLSKGSISRWENDLREPTNSKLSAYSKYFGVSLDWLLGIDSQAGYYTDPETAELAEKFRNNSDLRVLFQASADLSPEKMREAYNYIKFLRDQEKSEAD